MRMICFGLAMLVAVGATARPRKTMYDFVEYGHLVSVDAEGRWRPLRDATVTLTCPATSEASGDNEWRNACDAVVRVEHDGKVVARQKPATALGVDWKAVGGQGASLELALLDVGELALVVVRSYNREGDEWSKEETIEQLLVVDGSELREVYRHTALSARDPGPDGPESERERTEETITVGSGKARGVPVLVVVSKTNDERPQKTTLEWDGKSFVERALVLPPPGPLVDKSGVSLEPLLLKVFTGQKLEAAELAAVSPAGLAILRNAPFARHGRPFKKPELHAFFYSARPADRASKLLPQRVNPRFSEKDLDVADLANVAAVIAAAKRRR